MRKANENKQAKNTLKELKEIQLSILSAISHAVIGLKERTIIFANDAVETVFGWKPEELVGSSTRVLYRTDEEYEEIARHFYPVLEEQQSYTEEFPCRRKDGRDIVCRISASKIGKTLKEKGIVVIYEDITELKQAEIALTESENKFKGLVEGSIAGVYIIQGGMFKYVNQRFAEIHGYTVEEMVGKLGVKETMLPDDLPIVEENIRKRISDKTEVVHYAIRAVRKDKKIIHVEIYGTHMMYQGKQAVMGTLIDITERKRAEDALKRAEEKYRNIFENAMVGIYQSTPEGRYLSVNPAMARIFGYSSPEEMIKTITNTRLQTYVNPDDRIRFKKLLESGEVVGGFEIQRYRKDKGKFWVSINSRAVFDESGKVLYYEGIAEDVTERKKAEETITHMAYHDTLTGLPNRMLFNDRLSVEIARTSRHQKRLAVMMLDLDRFKDVNDTFGHDVGDMLLKAVAEGLTKLLRKSDTVARLGGDEFILILTELNQVEDTSVIARNIIDSFKKPFQLNSHTISITTSIGIAVFPEDGGDANTLVKNADTAMYRTKQAGRNNYQWYSKILKDN